MRAGQFLPNTASLLGNLCSETLVTLAKTLRAAWKSLTSSSYVPGPWELGTVAPDGCVGGKRPPVSTRAPAGLLCKCVRVCVCVSSQLKIFSEHKRVGSTVCL